jgi:hypothetical protein
MNMKKAWGEKAGNKDHPTDKTVEADRNALGRIEAVRDIPVILKGLDMVGVAKIERNFSHILRLLR